MNNYPQAVLDVIAERKRQVCSEGWTAKHDDEHRDGSMALAAACYACNAATWAHREPGIKDEDYVRLSSPGFRWPWARNWWKPKSQRRDLVRAAALLLAEIERIDRAGALGVKAWREPISQDPHTQAQAAAVMLAHGTSEQQRAALSAVGVKVSGGAGEPSAPCSRVMAGGEPVPARPSGVPTLRGPLAASDPEWLRDKLAKVDDSHVGGPPVRPCDHPPGCNAKNCLGCGETPSGVGGNDGR